MKTSRIRTHGQGPRGRPRCESVKTSYATANKGHAHAREQKLTVKGVEKRGGQTYSVNRKPIFACFNKDCRRKWDSGAQPWDTAVASFWSHLENWSEQEEIEAREAELGPTEQPEAEHQENPAPGTSGLGRAQSSS